MSNRNAFVISVLSISLTACAQINELGTKKSSTASPEVKSSSAVVVNNKNVQKNVGDSSDAVKKDLPVTPKYLGMVIKDGMDFEKYSIRTLGQSGKFDVFSAEVVQESAYINSKIALVADKAGKVIDSRDVQQDDIELVRWLTADEFWKILHPDNG